MEYVEQILKTADFSRETNLKITLGKQLFSPVKSISFEELLKKNGMSDKRSDGLNSSNTIRHSRIRENTDQKTITPPKKDG
ncbi:MAG: hypothetical protein K6A23_06110, partial [Butyrivibrio sp.]|nr:hypothetical protein [Butyrivibrio sp.]